jgi:hypothetical protein
MHNLLGGLHRDLIDVPCTANREEIRLMMDSVRITAFPLIPADHSANSILQSVRSHKSHPKIHRFLLGSVVPFFLSVHNQMVAR